MLETTPATDSASPFTLRRGLAAATTLYPSFSRIFTTPLQLDASANAPCTRTIVAFAASWASAAGLPSASPIAASVTIFFMAAFSLGLLWHDENVCLLPQRYQLRFEGGEVHWTLVQPS